MKKETIKVQVMSARSMWPDLTERARTAGGTVVQQGLGLFEFRSLDEAKRFVESLEKIELLEDRSTTDPHYGDIVDIDYTVTGVFHGPAHVNVFNMNRVTKDFFG